MRGIRGRVRTEETALRGRVSGRAVNVLAQIASYGTSSTTSHRELIPKHRNAAFHWVAAEVLAFSVWAGETCGVRWDRFPGRHGSTILGRC